MKVPIVYVGEGRASRPGCPAPGLENQVGERLQGVF